MTELSKKIPDDIVRQADLEHARRGDCSMLGTARSNPERLVLMTDAMGDVAHELLRTDGGDTALLRGALIRLAAQAASWAEFLDRATLTDGQEER